MAKLKINGLEELIAKLDKIESSGLILSNAIKEKAENLQNLIKADTPVYPGHFIHGKDYLKWDMKIDSKTLKVADIGFKYLSGDSWDKWKGVYFQHFGFRHARSGKRVEVHKMWFDKSVKRHRAKIKKNLMDKLEKHIGNVIK